MTLAWLAAGEAFPPPGRTRLAFADAEAELVSDPYFSPSISRQRLWDGLGAYLARFVLLEQRHQSLLSEPLVPFVWLGGSFVSNEQDPRNLDVTVALSATGRLALRGHPGPDGSRTRSPAPGPRQSSVFARLSFPTCWFHRCSSRIDCGPMNRTTCGNAVPGTTGGSGSGMRGRRTSALRRRLQCQDVDTWR